MLLSFEGFLPPTIPGRLPGAVESLGESTLARRLCPHCRNEWRNTDDVHDPREIVGEHVQRHLGGHPWQRLGNGPADCA